MLRDPEDDGEAKRADDMRRLLGEVIIDAKSMLSGIVCRRGLAINTIITEVLSNGYTRIWSEELKWSWLRSTSNNVVIFHSTEIGSFCTT